MSPGPVVDGRERETLVELIKGLPNAECLLPEWAYVKGRTFVRTEVDGLRVLLHRWLYEEILSDKLGSDVLRQRPEVNAYNVNPLLMERVHRAARAPRERCPNGHVYAEVGETTVKGARCAQCVADRNERRRVGGASQADLNRAKTHCNHGHRFTPENTLYWPSDQGRRRCATCEHDRSVGRTRPKERTLR